MKADILIFSDVHLGSQDCRANELLKILKKVKAKKIIIAGDLFDHHYLHRLKKEHAVIDVRLRDHAARPNLSVLEKEFAFQKKILVIDDINDTGATFQYIIDNFGRHDRIRYAAVINNRPSPVKIDYYGYEIDKNETPQWVVFPWEEWQK